MLNCLMKKQSVCGGSGVTPGWQMKQTALWETKQFDVSSMTNDPKWIPFVCFQGILYIYCLLLKT